MRYKFNQVLFDSPPHKLGDERREYKFLLFPKILDDELRWLEGAWIQYKFRRVSYDGCVLNRWVPIHWTTRSGKIIMKFEYIDPFPGDDPLLGKRITCCFCNKEEELQWMTQINEQLYRDNHCFYCNFWFEKVQWLKDKDPNQVIILEKESNERHHYHINPDQSGGMRGFGGSKFKIKFNDGRIVESKNLWHQGDIPKMFYNLLPINAEFLYNKDI